MPFINLAIVFLVIVVLLSLRRPLYQALLGGVIAAALLFRFAPADAARRVGRVFSDWSSLSVLVSLYLITLLQRMMDARGHIKAAGDDLDRLFHNRRVNATVAPLFIGLLPSAAAMILCADIVRDATREHLDDREQAFVTSWFRHIPESALPTYSGVLLMTTMSGVSVGRFLPGMLVPMLALWLIGFAFCLRKVPGGSGAAREKGRPALLRRLLGHLWPLVLILVLILAAGLTVVPAVAIAILACEAVYRFPPRQLLRLVVGAFDVKLLLNTFLVLVLKEFIAFAGVLEQLPAALSALAIPPWLVFTLLFFLGGIISGSTGIIAMGAPLAFSAMPGGMPLAVLLMCASHAASQISPTHVCLVVASDYYKIPLGSLIRKTIPAALLFVALMIGYYHLLLALGVS